MPGRIRKVKIHELRQIKHMLFSNFAGDRDNIPWFLVWILDIFHRGRETYVCVVDREIVGAVTIQEQKFDKESVYHLFMLVVKKPFRGKGYGKRLLRYAEKKVKSYGASRIILSVDISNVPAINLYKKEGYRCSGKLILEKNL